MAQDPKIAETLGDEPPPLEEDDELEGDDDSYCAWTDDKDEQRRAYIIHEMNADISSVALMHQVYEWLKTGQVPEYDKRTGKLKVVPKE